MNERVRSIEDRLRQAFSPTHMELIDASQAHAGHAEAGGAGHFYLRIVSPAFAGKSLVQRHQMVYQALAEFMPSQIHALSIQAYTPEEYSTKG
ncbi:BolA family transcriptional regulator [Methylothermus subterraneus]